MADVSLVDQHTNTVRADVALVSSWAVDSAGMSAHDESAVRARILASLAWLADRAGRAHQLEQDVREAAEAEEHLTARARSDADYEGAAIHSHAASVLRALAGGGQEQQT